MAGAEHGGAEAFYTRLCVGLAKAGLEQHAVIRHHPGRAAALREAGVATTELAFGGFLDRVTTKRLRAEIEAFQPQIVLTWMNRATHFCPAKSTVGHAFVHAARLGGYYNLKYYRGCDHLIANTRGIAAYLTGRGWAEDRVHHLPNFVAAGDSAAQRRGDLDTPEEAPLLLALGRLHRNKAFDVLLEALAGLPECYLWLAGEGPEESRLRGQAESLGVAGRVRFLGWREDTAALYKAADLFVCSSRHEPLGNVIIEAWSHGLPVVAARAAGPEELIADGRSGVLTPLEDAGALAAGIRTVLSDDALRIALAAQGRKSFETSYTEAAIVGRYRTLFEALAG